MENVIFENSPLAEYLEGAGKGSLPPSPASSSYSTSPPAQSFAPRGLSTLQSRIRDKLPRPLSLHTSRHGSIGKIHSACSRAVNSRLGRADNQRFLEHFRYLIVASQLLGEQSGLRAAAIPSFAVDGRAGPQEFKVATTSLTGAVLTGATAFTLVWLVHWSRSRTSGLSKARLLVVLAIFAVVATATYTYMRRQWLHYIRQQAVEGASTLVTNLQAFETSTSSALALIQEVELVSRGYRLSSPLPPISRLEEKGQARRCSRLRRSLRGAFAETIPTFNEECANLKQLIEEDDLEKYLDVYDINNPDLQEAGQGFSESEFEDAETLKALRTLQYRLSTLRRVYLCSLLSLEADGGKPDFPRWTVTVDSIAIVSTIAAAWSTKINSILQEEEQFVVPSPKVQSTPGRDRLRNSVRKLGSLSQGIRGLQAKMQILREESNKSLEGSEDVSELGSHLMAQYESIGADLKSLMQAWETGKNALAVNIGRHERRVSQASSGGLRSPVPSLGGLTAVDEGSPSDALRALNGGYLSPNQSAPSSVEGSNSDDEIFEAIAIPRTRPTAMSREERMQKIQDDRARQASLREQRDASNKMMRELESVINLRPQRNTDPRARVTSI